MTKLEKAILRAGSGSGKETVQDLSSMKELAREQRRGRRLDGKREDWIRSGSTSR